MAFIPPEARGEAKPWTPPEASKEQAAFVPPEASNDPTTGRIVAGVGTEIVAGVGGQAAGTAAGAAIGSVVPGLGTAVGAAVGYGVGSISSGIAGSIAAQKIEGQEDISWGRAIAAGLINLVPGGKGAQAGAKITAAVVGRAAAKGVARGAAMGATEATSRAIIDEGRLPTKEELAQYGGAGALFGGAIGGATPKLGKTFNKFLGKNADEIDDLIGRGDISFKEMKPLLASADDAAPRVRAEFQETRSKYQAIEAIQELTKSKEIAMGGQGKAGKLLASVIPSRYVGVKANQATIDYRRSVNEVEELGSRIANKLKREIKKNPSLDAKINKFIDTGEMDGDLYKIAGGELSKYQEIRQELQRKTLALLDEDAYKSLDPESKIILRQKIMDSINDKPYARTEYKIFLDKDYRADPHLEKAALSELSAKMGAGKAKAHMDKLQAASAATRDADPRSFFGAGVDSMLKRKHNPGSAERAWLGEVTEAPERIRGTLSGLGRSVARAKADLEIGKNLIESGIASSKHSGDMVELVLRGTGQEGTGIYVNPEVQVALNQIYLPSAEKASENIFLSSLQDLYRASVAGSKASKVLLNTVAYPVQLYGNTMNLLGMGINPFNRTALRGLDLAFAEFGGIDRLKRSPQARKAMYDEIQQMSRYGIKNANVLESDIRGTLDQGIFSKVLGKAIDPLGKAYSVPDTMGRYVGWKANQRTLRKLFPSASDETIKRQAAHLINDTYQNYDKLSNTVRVLSKWGVMPQFASFTAEFTRNQYNQGKTIARMLSGNYGSEFASELGGANVGRMRAEGAKRLASLTAVYGATVGAVEGVKHLSGVDEETEDALRDVTYAPWDKNRQLMVKLDKDGKTGWTANMSYISPHALGWSALQAGMKGDDESSIIGLLVDEFVGEGSFIMQEAFRSLENKNKQGRAITDELDGLKGAQDRFKYFMTEAFRPGVSREIKKFEDARLGRGDITLKDVGQRQLGIRKNAFNVDESAMFTVRGNAKSGASAKSKYRSLIKHGSPTENERLAAYETANRISEESYNAIRKNYESLKSLGRDDSQIIKIMKDGGLSSKDVLQVIDGNYRPISPILSQSTSDIYEDMTGGISSKRSQIREIMKQDRDLGGKLMNRLEVEQKAERLGVTDKDSLIRGLDTIEKVSYIRSKPNPLAYLRDLQRKRLVNDKVVRAVKLAEK